MRIFNVFTVAVLAIGFASTGAFADGPSTSPVSQARICNSDHPCNPGGDTPGGGSNCTAICGTPDVALNKDCSDNLAKLKHISGRDILAIDEQRIHIMPVCDTANNHSLTQAQLPFLQRGNVDGLRTSIESNPILMGKLSERGYDANDVLGILLGSNAAVLYVHKI